MTNVLIVGFGGFIGTLLRYGCMMALQSTTVNHFLATVFVNVFGSTVIGIVMGLQGKMGSSMLQFITIGLLGGFTTFSAFSLDVVNMLREGKSDWALAYILGTTLMSVGLAYVGFIFTQKLLS